MSDGIEARAEKVHRDLVELVGEARAAAMAGDPMTALAVLLRLVRVGAELRLLAERELGLLLGMFPDHGGRDPGGELPMGRRIRRAIGASRVETLHLRRFGELDDDAFEKLIDALWCDGLPPTATASTLVRAALRRESKATPSESG